MEIMDVLHSRKIIYSDPEIMSGVPVFKGSRVPLQTFFDYLAGEEGLKEFIDDFPYLKTQAIQVLENIYSPRSSVAFNVSNQIYSAILGSRNSYSDQ
jgi:uncharacterized protein (DUF433 family)